MKNPYIKILAAFLVVLALAQFIPEVINWVLVIIIVGMFLVQSSKYAGLISQFKL